MSKDFYAWSFLLDAQIFHKATKNMAAQHGVLRGGGPAHNLDIEVSIYGKKEMTVQVIIHYWKHVIQIGNIPYPYPD